MASLDERFGEVVIEIIREGRVDLRRFLTGDVAETNTSCNQNCPSGCGNKCGFMCRPELDEGMVVRPPDEIPTSPATRAARRK